MGKILNTFNKFAKNRSLAISAIYLLTILIALYLLGLNEDSTGANIVVVSTIFALWVSSLDRIKQEKRRAGEYARIRQRCDNIEVSVSALAGTISNMKKQVTMTSELIKANRTALNGPTGAGHLDNPLDASKIWTLHEVDIPSSTTSAGRIAAKVADDPNRLRLLHDMLYPQESGPAKTYIVGSDNFYENIVATGITGVQLFPDSHLDPAALTSRDRLAIEASGFYMGIWSGAVSSSGSSLAIRIVQLIDLFKKANALSYYINNVNANDVYTTEIKHTVDIVVDPKLHTQEEWAQGAPTGFTNLLLEYGLKDRNN